MMGFIDSAQGNEPLPQIIGSYKYYTLLTNKPYPLWCRSLALGSNSEQIILDENEWAAFLNIKVAIKPCVGSF